MELPGRGVASSPVRADARSPTAEIPAVALVLRICGSLHALSSLVLRGIMVSAGPVKDEYTSGILARQSALHARRSARGARHPASLSSDWLALDISRLPVWPNTTTAARMDHYRPAPGVERAEA